MTEGLPGSLPLPAHRPGRRTQRERVKESTRRLAVAAVELFGEQGFEATTTSQVGERAGYSREMVRKRYGSMEGLLDHLLQHELSDRVAPEPDRELSGLDQILSQVDRLTDLVVQDEPLARAFFVLCFETAGPVPRLRPWFSTWFADYEVKMKTSLRAGQKDGTIRHDLDLDEEARAFIRNSVGLAFRKVLDWDNYDFVGEATAWRATLSERYSP